MKETFSLFLLIDAIAFFSQKFIFQKRFGFISLSGIEIYVVGILFSFFIGGDFSLDSLAPLIYVVLAFVGFSFGVQFRKEIVRKITFRDVLCGFVISMQYFALFFVLDHFYSVQTSANLAAVFSIPAPLVLLNVKDDKFLISGEISIVFVLAFYNWIFFGFFNTLLAVAFGLLGLLFVMFARILKRSEIFILLFGLFLLIGGLARIFHFSVILSIAAFGFITAIFSKSDYTTEIKRNLEQPLFLSMLFFAGLFFSASFVRIIPAAASVFLKPLVLFPVFKKNVKVLVPFGALGIAIAMESFSFRIVTLATIVYFTLLFLFEFSAERLKWYI